MATKAPYRLEIYGLLSDIDFHRAKCCAEDLYNHDSKLFLEPFIEGMLEFDWNIFLEEKQKEMQGEMWSFTSTCLTLINGELIGNAEDFILFTADSFNFQDYRPLDLYSTLTEVAYKTHLNKNKHLYMYLDLAIDHESIGRLVIELCTSIAPKLCENFRRFCTSDTRTDSAMEDSSQRDSVVESSTGGSRPVESRKLNRKIKEPQMTYTGTYIHRIVPNGWIQGGDVGRGTGNTSVSSFGGVYEDENFIMKHDRRGIVGMANRGRHTNGSQFYITLQPTLWMDREYGAFGKVIEGTEVLKQIEAEDTLNERPKNKVTIYDCGQVEFTF